MHAILLKLLLTYYLNINVQAANLSDCRMRIESKKSIRYWESNRIFFCPNWNALPSAARAQEQVGQTRRLPDQYFDKQELCLHYINSREREMSKNTSRKMHTHRGQLILRKISKSDTTRCQILGLKCTKFGFRWGSVWDPTAGAYSAPADLPAVFKGACF